MPNLPELAREVTAIEKVLIEANGEITKELEVFLEKIKSNLVQKVENYDFIIHSLISKAEFLDSRAGEFWMGAKRITDFVGRLKDNIKIAMLEMQVKELQGLSKRMVLSNGQKKLMIQEDLLPQEYKMATTTIVPDKEKIKAALLAGKDIPGARLEDSIQLRTYVNTKTL